MMNTKLLIGASAAFAIFAQQAFADTSAISFEHNYRAHNRYHTDKLYLDYQFTNGLYMGVGTLLFNKKQDQYNDPVDYANIGDVAYSYKYNDQLTITPFLGLKFYTGTSSTTNDFVGEIDDSGAAGARYMPGLQVSYAFNDYVSAFSKYTYDARKFSHSKGTKATESRYRNIYQVGFDVFPIHALDIQYRYTYKDATFTMYDNRSSDYEQLLQLSYQIDRNWQPYLGFEDLAFSTTSDTRELRFTTGVNYYF